MTAKIALSELTDLARRALERAGASPAMASATAKALVAAEAQGLASRGVSRVPHYAAAEGVEIPQALLDELRAFAGQDPR